MRLPGQPAGAAVSPSLGRLLRVGKKRIDLLTQLTLYQPTATCGGLEFSRKAQVLCAA